MKFLLMLSFFFCSLQSFSQKLEVEAYGGLISSIFKGEEDRLIGKNANFIRRYAWNANFMLGVRLTDITQLKFGLGYASRGSGVESQDFFYYMNPGIETSHVKVNYLEVPILFFVGPQNINLIVGPQISFVTASDVRGLKESEIGLKYGVGIDTDGRFIIRLLFYNGLTNMINDSKTDFKNGYYNIAFGYKLVRSSVYIEKSEKRKNNKSKQDDIPHRVID